jgi:hypothetical protein
MTRADAHAKAVERWGTEVYTSVVRGRKDGRWTAPRYQIHTVTATYRGDSWEACFAAAGAQGVRL